MESRTVATEVLTIGLLTVATKVMTGWSWEESFNAAGFARGSMSAPPAGFGSYVTAKANSGGYGSWAQNGSLRFPNNRNISYQQQFHRPELRVATKNAIISKTPRAVISGEEFYIGSNLVQGKQVLIPTSG